MSKYVRADRVAREAGMVDVNALFAKLKYFSALSDPKVSGMGQDKWVLVEISSLVREDNDPSELGKTPDIPTAFRVSAVTTPFIHVTPGPK